MRLAHRDAVLFDIAARSTGCAPWRVGLNINYERKLKSGANCGFAQFVLSLVLQNSPRFLALRESIAGSAVMPHVVAC